MRMVVVAQPWGCLRFSPEARREQVPKEMGLGYLKPKR